MVFFFTAAISAAVPASTEVEAMYYELEKVSATVTSHETLFLLLHGVIDAPSGRFREKPAPSRRPQCTLKPAGSFSACIFALDSGRQMTSFRILCLMYLPEFFLHAKL